MAAAAAPVHREYARLIRTMRTMRMLGAALAAVLVGGLTTTPAQAAAPCDLAAPYRVVIGQPYKEFKLYASSICSQNGGSSGWDLIHPSQGSQGGAYFIGTSQESWDVYDFHTIGLHTWRPSGAFDSGGDPLTQNTVQSDIRLATAAWITSKRTSDVVTLTGTSLLYSTGSDSYFKRSAKGAFQFKERGTTTWKGLKAVTTSSAGVATMSYR